MGANLADLVKNAAERRPDHPAIVAGGRVTTWAEVDRHVHAVSGGLAARRLERGDRVAIVLENSLEFVTTYFGVLRAGLVAVPINPTYSSREISALLRSCGAKLAVASHSTAAQVRAGAGAATEVIEVGTDDWRRLTVGSTMPPTEDTDPESLAVLLFTGGTSGQPKGAMLTHRALLANLDQMAQLTDPVPTLPDDIAYITLPLSHIYALNTALGSIVKFAATAVLADTFTPAESLRMIQLQHVTTVVGVPGMYVAWLDQHNMADALSQTRMLVSGASHLPAAVFKEYEALGMPIWEGYGMTEAAPAIATTAVSGQPKAGFVGKPLPGIEVKLVDDGGNEVEENDPGELYVRGPNLFSGYWPDGHDGPNSEGWFATGDIAIADEENDLRLVDRRHDMILVSGFNVYPREIEAALSLAPGVAEIAVVGIHHDATGEAVKAIVVPKVGIDLTPEAILEFGSQRLARFKLPSVVEIVDQLPHSVTGKVIKSALRDQERDDA